MLDISVWLTIPGSCDVYLFFQAEVGIRFFFFFLMLRRTPRSTLSSSSAASDVYKRQGRDRLHSLPLCRRGIYRDPEKQNAGPGRTACWGNPEPLFPELEDRRDRLHVPVSYTHLRAHETGSYLVCRLLLGKKKKNQQSIITKKTIVLTKTNNDDKYDEDNDIHY